MAALRLQTMTSIELTALVEHFLASVSRADELMKLHLKVGSPYLWQSYRLSQVGKLDGGSYSYFFHGVGCRFCFEDYEVDFDYGHNGRIDGFDLWRLDGFAEQYPKYKGYQESGSLKADFEAAIRQGEIEQVHADNHDSLYYCI